MKIIAEYGNKEHLHLYEIIVSQYPGMVDAGIKVYANNKQQAIEISKDKGYDCCAVNMVK